MTAANFTTRRADTLEVGDVIHTRAGARTVLGVTVSRNLQGVTVTCADPALGEFPRMFLNSDLVHTQRWPS